MNLVRDYQHFLDTVDGLDFIDVDPETHRAALLAALAPLAPRLGFDPTDAPRRSDGVSTTLILLVTIEEPTVTLFAVPNDHVGPLMRDAFAAAHGVRWETPNTADIDVGEVHEWAATVVVVAAITSHGEDPVAFWEYFVGSAVERFDDAADILPDLDTIDDVLGMYADFQVEDADELTHRIDGVVCLNAHYN